MSLLPQGTGKAEDIMVEFTKPTTRPCKTCRAVIQFIEGENGRAIPVQEVRRLYAVNENGRLEVANVVEGGPYFVSHFETCPDAGQFSKGKKR